MEKQKYGKSLVYAIVGVMVLIVTVAGSAYAYYQASATNNTSVTGTAGGGEGPTLTVKKESTGATGNLIPINMTTDDLTNGAKGWGTNAVNTGWNASKSCIDKNGYTVCQVYSVTVKNNSNTAQTFNINLTSLTGASAPNLEAVAMASNISVTDVTSIKSNGLICATSSLAANATSTKCYFMVFIKNLSSAQTDSGTFTGTVTATSSTGAQIYAQFS